MNADSIFDVAAVCLYSASLVGWGFFWGFEFGTGQIRLRLRCLRLVQAVVKPLATMSGAIFWRLESLHARLRTAIANEEAGRWSAANGGQTR